MAIKSETIRVTFGGGINSRRRPSDIDLNECIEGNDFDLSPELLSFNKRPAFDLIGTAPNAGEIRGFAQNINRAGTVTTVIQAGAVVYSWDHATTFATVGVVGATAQLRGAQEQIDTLNQRVYITDLNQAEVVKTWDGSTFADFTHNLTATNFYARYCRVWGERAFFANVKSGTDLPHMVVGSKLSDPNTLSISNRPANVSNPEDPFYLLTPDLRPINGMEEAFGSFLISTKRGRLFNVTGSTSFDYKIQKFYTGSAVSGAEAIVNVGNDIALGLPGRVESLSGTINYGDVESDDLSLPISNNIKSVSEWTLAYDRKLRLIYCFPSGVSAVYVAFKKLMDANSPWSAWSKWTTGHAINFQPSTVMPMVHPVTKDDLVYMGDTLGRIFLLNGTGGKDGGTTSVSASRKTGLIVGIPEGNVFDVEGYIKYRKQFAATVTLTFEFAGEGIFDKSITIDIPAGDTIDVYNGSGADARYYNSADGSAYVAYYGKQFSERIHRQKFGPPGFNAHFQLRIEVESQGTVDFEEVGFKFKTAE